MKNPNLDIFKKAVRILGPLSDEMVFLGGCATGLLLTDPAAPPIRVTDDVDAIVEAASLAKYYQLADRLRERSFIEDKSLEAPICRWRAKGVVLDVMPTNPEILGFGNRWFGPAVAAAVRIELYAGRLIRMVAAPYFLATKLEAFDGRGNEDYLMSHDMEDIIALMDGRAEIVEEVIRSSDDLKSYLAHRFAGLLEEPRFIEALPGHLPPDRASQGRLPMLINRIRQIAGFEKGVAG